MGRYKKGNKIGMKKKGADKKKTHAKKEPSDAYQTQQADVNAHQTTTKRKREKEHDVVTSTPKQSDSAHTRRFKRTRTDLVLPSSNPLHPPSPDHETSCSPFSPGSVQMEDISVSSVENESGMFKFDTSMVKEAIFSEHAYASQPSCQSEHHEKPQTLIPYDDGVQITSVENSFAAGQAKKNPGSIIIDGEFPIMHGPHYPQDYMDLRDKLQSETPPGEFEIKKKLQRIRYVSTYDLPDEVSIIKVSVTITPDYQAAVRVHNQILSPEHHLWIGLPTKFDSKEAVYILLSKIEQFSICVGNTETEYIELAPPTKGISYNATSGIQAYHESNFSEDTVRGVACSLLVKDGRCECCKKIRQALRMRKWRKDNVQEESHKFTPNCHLSPSQLMSKTKTLAKEKRHLESQIDQMKRKIQNMIRTDSPSLDEISSVEVSSLVDSLNEDVIKGYEPGSFQRLFWEQQVKYNKSKDPRGMRWHPLIIKWCVYLQSRSSKAFESMRKAGFINLPSQRTLYDYTHFCKSETGFSAGVIDQLLSECEAKGMNKETWRRYVGLLQDEIKIKEDIVYDKHSGELIGYVELDSISNQLADLERSLENSSQKVAKYMLVLMVRGISSDLKYPLAAFATNGITADFLYPILWEAIGYLEGICELYVIFITCDGASPNRKFFELHRGNQLGTVFWTVNPFSTDQRKLYFISDPPHLIKTARNCFANSNSHKKTRQLWKGGKDVSWMHIVQLFTEHVENKVLSPCPKLTRQHVDLTGFAQMKVNLAAQVFSKTVACALRRYYGNHVLETVNFLEKMNDFFDIMNTNTLNAGRRQRNPNLNVFEDQNDPRLTWLEHDFLKYFDEWQTEVESAFVNEPKKSRDAKQLSHQTLSGLRISVLSVVACIRFLLSKGVPFVRTVVFNQDVLEQQFGHYRRRGGANDNPTCYEIVHTINTLRVAHGQAIASIRGNITGNAANQLVDVDVPLPRRAKYETQ